MISPAIDTVPFGSFADTILRSRGFDPDSTSLSAKEKDQYADLVNEALSSAWRAQPWPQLFTVSRRRYRPDWSESAAYLAGHEAWRLGSYWRALRPNLAAPPESSPEDWEPAAGICRFIAFRQPWTDEAGRDLCPFDPSGVELHRFAFASDPLLDPLARPLLPCRFLENCVLLPPDAPDEVFVRYRPDPPVFTFDPWSATAAYSAGDTCLDTSGRSWRARAASTGLEPARNPSHWEEIGIPRIFAAYVRLYCKAALASDDEGRYRTLALADNELEQLASRWISNTQSGGSVRWANPRFGRAF